jgi:DNA-binding NarL/FixJ family response regulator
LLTWPVRGKMTDCETRVTQPRLLDPAAAPPRPLPAISVVLIADNRSTRQGVLALIRRQPGFRVLASAGLTGEAVRMVRDVRPDIVLLHLGKATDDDALTVAGALHGEAPASRVVVMGLPADSTDLESFIRARVSGFLMANATFSEFLATIDRVVRGEQVLPPALAAGLFAQLTSERLPWHRKPVAGGAALTGRELEVADLIILGRSNKEIATRLGIALHTVKSHVHKVLTKLACNSRLEVAAFAQRGARERKAPPT